MPKEKNNWEKKFVAKQFKEWFNIELNTPISGRIVAEESGYGEGLERFDKYIKETLSVVREACKAQRTQLIQEFKEIVGEDERMNNLKGDFRVNWLNWVITNPKGWKKMGSNRAKQEIRDKLKAKYETKEKEMGKM